MLLLQTNLPCIIFGYETQLDVIKNKKSYGMEWFWTNSVAEWSGVVDHNPQWSVAKGGPVVDRNPQWSTEPGGCGFNSHGHN